MISYRMSNDREGCPRYLGGCGGPTDSGRSGKCRTPTGGTAEAYTVGQSTTLFGIRGCAKTFGTAPCARVDVGDGGRVLGGVCGFSGTGRGTFPMAAAGSRSKRRD